MYDRAILLMYKDRQKGFPAFVCLTLDTYQLEAVHWPKEIRRGLLKPRYETEWTNFWQFSSVNTLSEVPALCNVTDFDTSLLGCICAFYSWYLFSWHMLSNRTYLWLAGKLCKQEVKGWNQLWNDHNKWSFCLSAKVGMLLWGTNKQKMTW